MRNKKGSNTAQVAARIELLRGRYESGRDLWTGRELTEEDRAARKLAALDTSVRNRSDVDAHGGLEKGKTRRSQTVK